MNPDGSVFHCGWWYKDRPVYESLYLEDQSSGQETKEVRPDP
jgi:hypothetical protein